MKKYKWIGWTAGIVLAAAGVALFLIRYYKPEKNVTTKTDTLNLVILDSGDYYYSDDGIEHGIDLALKDLQKEQGITIKVKRVDDGGNYVNGISLAKALSEDDRVDAVISFQNFESIGAEVDFFEQAQKPFIVTMGCYDEVAEKGYSYLITDFLSGKMIGERIGEYLKSKKICRVALCHSDTVFEKDEMKGIQSVVNRSDEMNIYHTQTGPFDDSGLAQLLTDCDKLEIDAVIANFYTQTDSAWLLSGLRKKRPGMMVVGDYALDSSEILKEYGKDLEGVVIVPVYPYQESEKLQKFTARYEQECGAEFSTAAVQYYDLFRMLGKAAKQKASGRELMKTMKNEKGYEGVAGTITFDEKGRLFVENCPVFVCRNSRFVRLD